jgi:hypothetical protein
VKLLLFLVTASALLAQPVVAPTPERAGSAKGDDLAGYNIVNSMETGYRFRSVDGNLGKYRSDVNFGNGIRVLGSYLTINSKKPGTGKLFDEIVLSTQGLGNDPYQFSSLRVQKNKAYRFDSTWRWMDYFNPALTIANGQHSINTTRQLQDHDLILLPQARFRVLLGYSRNQQDGPSFSTLQFPDGRGDEFTYLWNVRRTRNEYRLGTDFEWWKTKVHILHGWEYFKDDTRAPLASPGAGANPNDTATLTRFRRDEPTHGQAPYWRVGLHNEALKVFTIDGRFTHVTGQRNFLVDELAIGTGRFGSAQNRQVLVGGNARRPVTTGNLTLSLFPTERLTVTNHTAVYNTRMEGEGTYGELNNAIPGVQLLNFQYLGIRTVANLTDANLRLTRWLGLYSGYHFSERRIASSQFEDIDAPTQRIVRDEQTNRLHSGLAGLRLQPVKQLRLSVDGELGRADRPFYTTSEKDYHAVSARAQWKTKQWSLLSKFQTNYNLNSNSLFVHSARSRVASIDGTWSPRAFLNFEAGYGHTHIETITGLAYFSRGDYIENERSLYRSRLRQIRLGAQINIAKKADLYFGYHRIQDAARGRLGFSDSPDFFAAQVFPLTYETPLARFSIQLHKKVRWNLGWQYYNYKEQFQALQDYNAQTGYTSLSWSF